jgi:chromosome segregation ATPase
MMTVRGGAPGLKRVPGGDDGAMNLELLFPPTLIKRVVEDLSAIADACRRLPELEQQVLVRIDGIRAEAFARADTLQAEITEMREGVAALQREMTPIQELPAVREAIETLPARLDAMNERLAGLQAQMTPIQELPVVRAAIETLPDKLDEVNAGLGTLQEEMSPIQELPAMRAAVEPLGGKFDHLQDDLNEQLRSLRSGIEPLDEDMRSVRGSIDEIEPLIRQVLTRLGALDKRIEAMRTNLGPLGDLADKIPGVG